MWGVPGSHKKPTTYFMKQFKGEDGYYGTTYNTEKPTYDLKGGVPLPAEKGSIVLLHGDFVHYRYYNIL